MEEFIGKKLSTVEIFEQFPDLAVLGEPDSSEYPTIYITIRYIGTPDEMEKVRFESPSHLAIHYGKHSRKGSGVICNSGYVLEDLVGIWNMSVTEDGGQSDEMLVLCSDGTGAYAEANFSPYWETPITWYVEDDILTICSDHSTLCHIPIKYERDIIVPCMSKEEKHFTGLMDAAYEHNFYRKIGNRTLEEAEAEAQYGMEFLHDEFNVDSDTGDEILRNALAESLNTEETFITDLIEDKPNSPIK